MWGHSLILTFLRLLLTFPRAESVLFKTSKAVPPPTMSFEPWPAPYRLFFTVVEPALTLGGVVYSVFTPREYYEELIPRTVAPVPLEFHPAILMVVRQLGSCFFLLALLATFLLRRIQSTLSSQPHLLEPILHTYLLCLAIADLTHIGFTYYDLGLEGALDWKNWNTLVWGNCIITLGLFVVRSMWFAGIGRDSASDKTTIKKVK